MEGAGVGNVEKSFAVCILTRQQGKRSMTHVNPIQVHVVGGKPDSVKIHTVAEVIIHIVRSDGN